MAKKAKAKKTTTATTKKKEGADKPKAPEEQQPDLTVQVEGEQAEVSMETAEPVAPEPPRAAVPTVAPSVAVVTRHAAAVPVAVPETPVEPATPAASPEPVAAEPPPTGILAILNVKSEAEAGVTLNNLSAYRSYLEKNLNRPIRVYGREPFGWERPYAWGLRDRAAYEARKAACPSYTDDLEIVSLEEELDTIDGIAVRVSRPADGKEFTLQIGSLTSSDAGSKNAEILDDFAKWLTESR
ncbi:MAG: hypothetical protein AB9873_15205 [Syntrophobacteraceae bacterium]